MPINKQAYIRYQTLDKCFRNPWKKYFIDDLSLACAMSLEENIGSHKSISNRQIFEDIKFMESSQGWSAEVLRFKDGRKVYYRYADTNFSINNNLLNEQEEIQLSETLSTLLRFKGMPQFEWIEEMALRLSNTLKLNCNVHKIIEFEQNPYLRGLNYITEIYNAAISHKALEMHYKGIKNLQSERYIISPYYLKQYNNRWFLLAKINNHAEISIFAIDRIQQLKISNETYILNNSIDFTEYFDDVIGVTIQSGMKPEKILLRISKDIYPYLETKPIHGSQKLKEKTANHVVIELNVIPNYELYSTLLAFGESLTVIEPNPIAKHLKKTAYSIYSNY